MHKNALSQIRVAVVGGSGYGGSELLRLLKKHPQVGVLASFNSQSVSTLRPNEYDVVFLATPAEVSVELAPSLLAAGSKLIDLSGAFRLTAEDYPRWYGMHAPVNSLLSSAHYGLVPWAKPAEGTMLVSNPGCYASAVLMGLLPLLSAQLIDPATLVIDAKSGTTGAGKKAVESQLFSEVADECLPYKVGCHQHLPEIQRYAEVFAKTTVDPFFTTSLLPLRRGIIAGLYARLADGKTASQVETAFREFYLGYPLVKVAAGVPRDMVSLKNVAGTAMTHISFQVVGDKLYLFSCLDNLLKGAASQAVENFNLLHHWPVTMGLEHLEAII